MGIKIAGNDLQKAVAGTSLLVLHPEDEIEDLKEEVMRDLEAVMGSLAKVSRGVFVQASTLGASAVAGCARMRGVVAAPHVTLRCDS
jgi:translation initiation factor 5B